MATAVVAAAHRAQSWKLVSERYHVSIDNSGVTHPTGNQYFSTFDTTNSTLALHRYCILATWVSIGVGVARVLRGCV